MSVKNVSLVALALALLGIGSVRAQDGKAPIYRPDITPEPPTEPGQFMRTEPVTPGDAPVPADDPVPPASLSSWILYNQPGPSIPTEGEIFGRALETGWAIQGGSASCFITCRRPRPGRWT
jgi:hypothetical protein